MPRFRTSDGLSLHYEDAGAGLPVLCLSGLTRTGADFDYVAPHLDDCRLIRLDYRGRGQSDWDPNWQNYALPVEGRDALELLDHLGLERAAIIGTSRGGLIAMGLASTHHDRLLGVALNDVGPELDPTGLAVIMTYLGKKPVARNHAEVAEALAHVMTDFDDVPASRWMEEAKKHFVISDNGLDITYDPALRDAVAVGGEMPDLWPFFDALEGLPLAAFRGVNSSLLSVATFDKMKVRRPDMIAAEVAGRGHVPFLDEAEAVAGLHKWIEAMT
ncbi:MAG: alpha/beta hydrolase [Pseudomonadota bacterium]